MASCYKAQIWRPEWPIPARLYATAREIRSQYEFYAHARLAREAGVPEDTLKSIANGTAPEGLSGDEAMLVRFTKELVSNHKISDPTFNAVRDRFGMQKRWRSPPSSAITS